MGKFNKATASVISGSVVTAGVAIAGSMGYAVGSELAAAISTVLATVMVWMIPNRS